FTRGDSSRNKESGGYGVEMAIAARILQRQRGSIKADNASGGGACFTLTWPL
ncbi:MAG: ATP-binding protein, partial [Pseudohongiellaceae bacterium]